MVDHPNPSISNRLNLQHVSPPKTEPPASAVLLFFRPCFPLAPFHALFCRKTPPKFKPLGGKRGEGEQRAASCGMSPLPSPNRATPLPSGAGSQRPRLSQSTNRASPTRNRAACSDLPQKCSFSQKYQRGGPRSQPPWRGDQGPAKTRGSAKQVEVCVAVLAGQGACPSS